MRQPCSRCGAAWPSASLRAPRRRIRCPLARRALAIGVLAHDQGPFSDHNENGVDLNLEAQFAPLALIGSPRPHLGVTANFSGETSVAYAGLGLRLYEQPKWFVDGLLGATRHNGPLHKDPLRCDLYSDCSFGIRVLPRFGVGLGYRTGAPPALSLSVCAYNRAY